MLIFLSEIHKDSKIEIEKESCSIYDNLHNIYGKIKKYTKDLAKVSEYLETFFPHVKDKIELNNNIKNILHVLLKENIVKLKTSKVIEDKIKSYKDLIIEAYDNMKKKKKFPFIRRNI